MNTQQCLKPHYYKYKFSAETKAQSGFNISTTTKNALAIKCWCTTQKKIHIHTFTWCTLLFYIVIHCVKLMIGLQHLVNLPEGTIARSYNQSMLKTSQPHSSLSYTQRPASGINSYPDSNNLIHRCTHHPRQPASGTNKTHPSLDSHLVSNVPYWSL